MAVVAAFLLIGIAAIPEVSVEDDGATAFAAFQTAFREAVAFYRREQWVEAEAAFTRAQQLYTQAAAGYDAQRWSQPLREATAQTARDATFEARLEAAAAAVRDWMPLAEVSEYLGDLSARQGRWTDAALRYRLAVRWRAQRVRMFDLVRRLAPDRWVAERAELAAAVAAPYAKLLAIVEDSSRARQDRIVAAQMVGKLTDLQASAGIEPRQDLERLAAREADADVKAMLEVIVRRLGRQVGVVTQGATPEGSASVIRRLQAEPEPVGQ